MFSNGCWFNYGLCKEGRQKPTQTLLKQRNQMKPKLKKPKLTCGSPRHTVAGKESGVYEQGLSMLT